MQRSKYTYIFRASALYILVALFFAVFPVHVRAACNIRNNDTAALSNVTCSIDASTIEGVDAAAAESSTTNTAQLSLINTSITINDNGTMVAGSVVLTGTSTISTLASGAKIKTGSGIWVADADADGWASDFTLYDSSASGRRRLSLMRSMSTADCNDVNDYRINNSCCTVLTLYRDVDGDGYGNPAGPTVSACSQAGYAANNTDCYDANANAFPGSSYCGTTNRGDGSYDYNCSSTNTYCGTARYTTQWISGRNRVTYKCRNGSCSMVCDADPDSACTGIAAQVGCGVSGYAAGASSSCCISSCCPGTGYTQIGAYGAQGCQ